MTRDFKSLQFVLVFGSSQAAWTHCSDLKSSLAQILEALEGLEM